MKTRHILTAIALPALLAACTQDELVEVTGQQDYSDVPMVEATFTATKGDDVATKMATQFGWEEGDQIGLGWIGADATAQANAQVIYDNPLFCINPATGAFQVNTMLRVGKYVAYMPYAGLVNTGYVPFTVEGQGLYTTVDGAAKHFIYIDPKLANLVELNEGDQLAQGEQEAGVNKNVQLTMERLSNALTLNLNFSNHENLTDLKVYKVTLDANNGYNSFLATAFNYYASDKTTISKWSDVTDAIAFFTVGNGYVANNPTQAPLVLASEDGVAVEGNKLTLYATMLPIATASSMANLNITVETNYGNVTCTTSWGEAKDAANIVASHKDADGNIVFDEVWNNADLFNKLGTSGILDVAIDANDIEKTTAEVTTQEELEELLASLATSGQTTPIIITVNPASNAKGIMTLTDFELGADVLCPVTLTAGANAGNGFVFEGDNAIAGQLTLASPAQLNGTMAVENNINPLTGAQNTTLMLGENLTVNPGAMLTNSGKIATAFNKRLVTEVNAATGMTGLYVSAAKTASVDWATNNGEMQWIDGVISNVSGNGPVFAEVSTMDGILKVNRNSTDNKVNTLRIEEAADIVINSNTSNIKYNIDVNADTKITLNPEAESTTLQLGTILNVAEGVTLDITGEGEENLIKFNHTGSTHPAINVAADATFNVTNIEVGSTSNRIDVTYAGEVNWTNVVVTTGVTVNKTKVGDGVFTEVTED